MSFDNERYWITFNGEIYNYKELKSELLNIGCIFQTNTDTEVILAAFSVWGKFCVNKFVGMFSFAIFDKLATPDSPKLILYRDRFGIKPLLYTYHENTIYFASELKAFIALGIKNFKFNKDSILDYLSYGTVYQPKSILKDIQSVPAGCFLEVFKENVEIIKYWDLHEVTKLQREKLSNISYNSAIENIHVLLRKAIKYNLVSDVEIGVFLSGGIDSTSIVGLMNGQTSSNIHTYSVGFENRFNFMDETKFAQIAADHYKTQHKNYLVTTDNVLDFFEDIINSIDQPSIDGTNTWLVSKKASEDVKVALSGIGGDEIFAGYPHFHSIFKHHKKLFYGNKIINSLINWLHKLRPNFLTLKLLARFSPTFDYISTQRRVLENFEILKYVKSKWRNNYNSRISSIFSKWKLNDADIIQQISYIEINGYLQSILLRDSDIMSMAHGLEIRPVLLDHNLVEYVYSLPSKLKITNNNKQLLIDSVGDFFPDSLKNRKKMGFELPFNSWICGPLKNKFKELFQTDTAHKLFTKKFIDLQLYSILNETPTHSTWAIGILIAWIEKNNIEL